MEEEDKLDERLLKLGSRIKQIRESKGLSQTELAYKIDKDQPSINRVERGKINPSYLYLLDLANGLEVQLQELIP